MKFKKILAVSAALLGIFCTSLNVCADTLAEHDGLKYRVSDSGEESLYTGWTKKGSDRYYYKNGEMKKNCWLTVHGKRKYFLQADGKLAVGKVKINDRIYVFNENGVIMSDKQDHAVKASDAIRSSFEMRSKPYPEHYAGSWIEDNILHIAVTDMDEEVTSYYSGLTENSEFIEFEQRKYSLNELNKVKDALEAEWKNKYKITSYYVDEKGNTCVVEAIESDVSQLKNDLESNKIAKILSDIDPELDASVVVILTGAYAHVDYEYVD